MSLDPGVGEVSVIEAGVLLLGELCIYLGYAMELLRYVAAEIITYKSGYAKMKL